MTEIIVQTYQVLDEIKNDEIYIKLKSLSKLITKLYPQEELAFQKARAFYDQVMSEGGTHHPNYKETIKTLSETKAILYNKEEVKTYFKLEAQFEMELNGFLHQLANAVSNHVTIIDKMSFIKKGGSCHVR